MLQELATAEALAAGFAAHGGSAFPPAHDRAAWTGLRAYPAAATRLDRILANAAALDARPWPALPASLYLDFARTGNRNRFETPYFARRQRLGLLALAHAASGEARWAEALGDGLWLICDERSWCVPAHAAHDDPAHAPCALPDTDRPDSIDLFACETAYALAEACELAGVGLDGVHPAVRRRVRAEILRRVIEPLLNGRRPLWYGLANNWVPWCSASVITAAGWALADRPADWGRLVHGLLGHCDRFIAAYGPDGGCDEGVGYWGVAGGALARLLEEVAQRTGGALDAAWRQPLLANMFRFPARCHLGDGWYPSFADGPPRPSLAVAVPWRVARRIGDEQLAAWAVFQAEREQPEQPGGCGDQLGRGLRRLWWFDADPTATPRPFPPRNDWLPDLQVLVAYAGPLALAAKAGHNAENHNHNDVGQVVVHHQGRPVLVDPGRGEYTTQTFDARRYELWWTRASGHAVPLLDGVEQATGRQHAARAVRCTDAGDRVELAMDLAACYPRPGLTAVRRVVFDRVAARVEIRDRVGGCADYRLPLTFACPPQPDGDGWLVGGLRLSAPGLAGTAERIDLGNEPSMAHAWPDGLWRLVLRRAIAGEVETVVALHPA